MKMLIEIGNVFRLRCFILFRHLFVFDIQPSMASCVHLPPFVLPHVGQNRNLKLKLKYLM